MNHALKYEPKKHSPVFGHYRPLEWFLGKGLSLYQDQELLISPKYLFILPVIDTLVVNYDHQGMGGSGVVNMISPSFVYFCHSVTLELKSSSINAFGAKVMAFLSLEGSQCL